MYDSISENLLSKDIDAPLTSLLRFARETYVQTMREALKKNGFDDIPKNGIYIVGGIARTGSQHGKIVKELGLTKQAASQLIDSLVERGYLTRTVNQSDRRKANIGLTEKGREAASILRRVAKGINDRLVHKVGEEHFNITKQTLMELISINDER